MVMLMIKVMEFAVAHPQRTAGPLKSGSIWNLEMLGVMLCHALIIRPYFQRFYIFEECFSIFSVA